MKKFRILFFLFTNIKTGAGTEKSLYYYLKYADTNKFEITVLQTNLMPGGQRLSNSDLKEIQNKATFVEVKYYSDFFSSVKNKTFHYLFNLIAMPILFKILKITKYRKILHNIGQLDAIYLFDNNSSYIFPNSAFIIGSNHTAFDNLNSMGQKIFAKLMALHFIFPNIKAIHLFPHNMIFKKYFGILKLMPVNNGVDTDVYHPEEHTNKNIKILFVGRLEESKGIFMVLKVYNAVKEKIPLELFIVGSGTLETEVEKFAELDSNIHYYKHVSENDLAQIYRSCDIFFNPTLWDVLPLVVIEALASGLKVLTTNILYNAYHDFLRFNVIKFVDYDEVLMSEALICLIKGKIDKFTIYKYMEQNYSWKNISYQLFNSILNVVDRNK
jgi:glycosyltransferase involved in cell wall biosynthesis